MAEPDKSPVGQRKKIKKESITKGAAQVFAEKGFNSATVSEIAKKAGVGKGTVYEYFQSKTELFFEVFEWHMKTFTEAAALSLSALNIPVSKKLSGTCDSIMRYWVARMELYTLTLEFWAASATSGAKDTFKEMFKNSYREFRGLMEGLIKEGVKRGEFRPDLDIGSIAASLVGTLDALLLQGLFDEEFDPVTASAGYVEVLLRGMQRDESENRRRHNRRDA